MSLEIKRLGPGDEAVLTLLAQEDADFDLDDRVVARRALDTVAARRYLSDPAVLHWIAREDEIVMGFLYCLVVPLRSDAGRELLLYEIGVRRTHRRRGIGRRLLATMEEWMQRNQVADVWVLADNPAAADFYHAWGFAIERNQPAYLVRRAVVALEERGRNYAQAPGEAGSDQDSRLDRSSDSQTGDDRV